MQPFKYQREENSAAAVAALAQLEHSKFLAGGTNLIDLMKTEWSGLPLCSTSIVCHWRKLRLCLTAACAWERWLATAIRPIIRWFEGSIRYWLTRFSRGIAATAQSGHQWRQSFAAHALSLFHGYAFHTVQQARSGQRVRRN